MPVTPKDPEIYINECCWGGDVVRDLLLPIAEKDYEDVFTCQEDWGWLIWFRKGPVHLQINIHSDSRDGEFRVHLVSLQRQKKFLFTRRVEIDRPELEDLKEKVLQVLRTHAHNVNVERWTQ